MRNLRLFFISFHFQAVLSAIIIASLRSMFSQLLTLPSLFARSTADGAVFTLTLAATVLLDVDLGLILGVLANLALLLREAIFPRVEVVKETAFKDLVLAGELFHDVSNEREGERLLV